MAFSVRTRSGCTSRSPGSGACSCPSRPRRRKMREPSGGEVDGRLEHLEQRPLAELLEQLDVPAHRSRHRDGERAGARQVLPDLAVLHVHLRSGGGRRDLAEVDHLHLALAGQVHQREPASADPARLRLDDRERERGGHRRIHRVAPVAQDRGSRLAGERMSAGHRALRRHRGGGENEGDQGGGHGPRTVREARRGRYRAVERLASRGGNAPDSLCTARTCRLPGDLPPRRPPPGSLQPFATIRKTIAATAAKTRRSMVSAPSARLRPESPRGADELESRRSSQADQTWSRGGKTSRPMPAAFKARVASTSASEARRSAGSTSSGPVDALPSPASPRISLARSASSAGTTTFTPPTALLSHGWTPTRPSSRRRAWIPLLSRSPRAISASVGSAKVATTSGPSSGMVGWYGRLPWGAAFVMAAAPCRPILRGCASPPPPPGTCTSAGRALPCSTGCGRGSGRGASSCASRTRT